MPRRTLYSYKGGPPKMVTVLAREHGVSYDAVVQRLKRGWTIEVAIDTPLRVVLRAYDGGEPKTLAQLAREHGVPYVTFWERLPRGWALEAALATRSTGLSVRPPTLARPRRARTPPRGSDGMSGST